MTTLHSRVQRIHTVKKTSNHVQKFNFLDLFGLLWTFFRPFRTTICNFLTVYKKYYYSRIEVRYKVQLQQNQWNLECEFFNHQKKQLKMFLKIFIDSQHFPFKTLFDAFWPFLTLMDLFIFWTFWISLDLFGPF